MTMFDGGHSEYTSGELELHDLNPEPLVQLSNWLIDARKAQVIEPNAMTLATCSAEKHPSARMVLLRGIDTGLIFYTNYLSRKGSELADNNNASVCFWWGALERQVRVEGIVEKVSAEESDAYFKSRPRESQAASTASPQSQIIDGRAQLEADTDQLFADMTIERPDHWGGYRLIPNYFEFWQGRKARLHDRFAFVKHGNDWVIHRLAP